MGMERSRAIGRKTMSLAITNQAKGNSGTSREKYDSSERFWIWAVQYSVHRSVRGVNPVPGIIQGFHKEKVSSLTTSYLGYEFCWCLNVITSLTVNTIQCGCIQCGTVGPLEKVILACLSYAQIGDERLVKGIVANMGLGPSQEISPFVVSIRNIAWASQDCGILLRMRPEYLDLTTRIIPSSGPFELKHALIH